MYTFLSKVTQKIRCKITDYAGVKTVTRTFPSSGALCASFRITQMYSDGIFEHIWGNYVKHLKQCNSKDKLQWFFLKEKEYRIIKLISGRNSPLSLLTRHRNNNNNNICTVSHCATGQKYERNVGKPNGHTKRSNFGFIPFYWTWRLKQGAFKRMIILFCWW